MKKITQSYLKRILQLAHTYREMRSFQNEQETIEQLETFIKGYSDASIDDAENTEIVFSKDSDPEIASAVLKEKLKMLLKTILHSSDETIDKPTIESYIKDLDVAGE